MSLTRQLVATLAAATVVVGGLAGPAEATETRAAVPGCIYVSTWTSGAWTYARATNNCNSSYRFYFVWDRAVDGPCTTVSPGYWRQEGRLIQAAFRGFRDC
jgi:hypothetical protein